MNYGTNASGHFPVDVGVTVVLRAQVDNLYYLDEVLRRLNVMLWRDNVASDFVTLFYGVLDSRNRRLTYCDGLLNILVAIGSFIFIAQDHGKVV